MVFGKKIKWVSGLVSQSHLLVALHLTVIKEPLLQGGPRQMYCPNAGHLHPVWGANALLVLPIWL